MTLYQPVFDDDRRPVKKPYPVNGYNWRGEKWGTWIPVEPDYDKHYALMRQWSKSITRQEARILLDNSLGIGGGE